MNPNSVSSHTIQKEADAFLSTYHPSLKLPIPIEEISETQLGLFINLIPGIKNLLGIDAFISADFTQITIDEYSYSTFPARTRFSIAHEIGHKILHRDWYTNHGPKNIDESLTFQERLDEQTYIRIESQANMFSGLILAPRKLLITEIEKLLGKKIRLPLLPAPALHELTQIFDLSAEALLHRLLYEKIIRDPTIPF